MKPHIIVVDDKSINLEMVQVALQDNFELTLMQSGVECIERAPFLNPDLILLDIVMPDMDGYSVCQKLKESNTTAFIPIIFLSGLDDVEDKLEGFACGAEEYITKPFDHDTLIKTIGQVLDSSKKQKNWAQQYEVNKYRKIEYKDVVDQLYEMSTIRDFHHECALCHDVDSLGKVILKICHDFGLDASVQLDGPNGSTYMGCHSSSYEAQFLTKTHCVTKILGARNRSVFQSSGVAVLIKNMPENNPERYKRFRENMNILVESASNQLDMIGFHYKGENSFAVGKELFEKKFKNIENSINVKSIEIIGSITEVVCDAKALLSQSSVDKKVNEEMEHYLNKLREQIKEVCDINILLDELFTDAEKYMIERKAE